jgi:hypothetical protein
MDVFNIELEIAFNNNNRFYLLMYIKGFESDFYNVTEGTYRVEGNNVYVDAWRFIEFEDGRFNDDTNYSETDIFAVTNNVLTINMGTDDIALRQGNRSGIWWFGRQI